MAQQGDELLLLSRQDTALAGQECHQRFTPLEVPGECFGGVDLAPAASRAAEGPPPALLGVELSAG